MNKKGPGIRCVECGSRLDPGERCDCERIDSQERTLKQREKTRRIVAHNMRVMAQAQIEWDYR